MTAGLVQTSGAALKAVNSAKGLQVTQRTGYGKLVSHVSVLDKSQQKNRKSVTNSHIDPEEEKVKSGGWRIGFLFIGGST